MICRSRSSTATSAPGLRPGGIEFFLPLFFERTSHLFEYLPPHSVLVDVNDATDAVEGLWNGIVERHEQLRHDRHRPILDPAEVYLTPREFLEGCAAWPRVQLHTFEWPHETDGPVQNFPSTAPAAVRIDARAEQPAAQLVSHLAASRARILLAAESAGRRELILDLLRGRGVRRKGIRWLRQLPRERTEAWNYSIAGVPRASRWIRRRWKFSPSRNYSAIVRARNAGAAKPNAIRRKYSRSCRICGSARRWCMKPTESAVTSDCRPWMSPAIPVNSWCSNTRMATSSMFRCRRCTWCRATPARPAETAPLHKLGGDQWQKARRKAAQRIRDVAAELLDLYSRRAARQGTRMLAGEAEYRAFQAGFPFEETADQAAAIEQVIADLKSDKPMDRVICGDVGFGKTEVALRAAFIAVQAGKQVAVLVPTTLLAQQHYTTFADRFADWPVRVESLSRFRTNKEAEGVVKGIAEGKVDIVIATQRLLQGKVRFKDLGLVVIDEEHRFGVRDKEKLKALRTEVDVLTLTATPIPRTLNMAMGGLRDLSLITTPPAERLAVKTFVLEWNETVVREAVLREIRRGGQIYYVHNSIETIEKTAQAIRELVPEAIVAVGHGQMRERELEQLMLDFYHRRFNVLVCTTIIESGIDVPTANTIVIDRADRFGLAQIHQLRGRVGRSHHRAYAYLITPPRKAMTADAVKRLEALESLEELGAGFTLATHDLEIRGAGELLGDEQSGQIQEIGYNLYMELLERAVAALKSGKQADLEAPLDAGPEVELHLPALIPEDYVPDVHLRLMLYKRIAATPTREELDELKVEMIDRFGPIPPFRAILVPGRLPQAAGRRSRDSQDRRGREQRLFRIRRKQQDRSAARAQADSGQAKGIPPRRPLEAALRTHRAYRGGVIHASRAIGRATGLAEGSLFRTQKIPFADFDAALAQQRIHHARVKIKIGQHETVDIVGRGEFLRSARELQFDGAGIVARDLCGGHRLQKIHGLGNTRFQFRQRGFRILVLRSLDSRQTRRGAFGRIAGDLHLPAHRMHVGEQSCLREND